jgi:hypothetical protein
MRFTHDDSRHDLLTEADDGFHRPNDHAALFGSANPRWFHETCWFWWYVPEHALGGWFYNWVRPLVGTTGGGAWIWDDTTFFHLEVPYYSSYANLAFDAAADLRDTRFPSGVSVQAVEPLARYQLGFADRDLVRIDLSYDAVMPPWVGETLGDPPMAIHFDQVGRVRGSVELRGRRYDVDCLAIRDRTWSPRPERWKDGRVGYCNAASSEVAFLASSAAGARGETTDRVRTGYFAEGGRRARIVDGSRQVERDPEHGFVRRVTIEAEDSSGRRFTAVGDTVSRMAMPIPGVHGVVWTSLVDWTVDGTHAWGEDQDAWPIHAWSSFRRASLEARSVPGAGGRR